jgi:hypothetical protein
VTLGGESRSTHFHLDRSLVFALREDDIVYIARTAHGGLGVSLLREGRLVAAVGAASAVPLGEGVQVRVAPDLWEHATADARPEPGSNEDPRDTYRHEQPLHISINGVGYLYFRRNQSIDGIHLFIKHGFYTRRPNWARGASISLRADGPDKMDECVALARVGVCPEIAANASAYLLAADGLETDRDVAR